MRSSLQIMYDTDSPPPKSAKGVPPTDTGAPINHETTIMKNLVSLSCDIIRYACREMRGFSWWFFYHSMFNIQVTFTCSKGATVRGAHNTIMNPSGKHRGVSWWFFYRPCLISRWLIIVHPVICTTIHSPRDVIILRQVAVDGGFFIAHVWYPGDFW